MEARISDRHNRRPSASRLGWLLAVAALALYIAGLFIRR